MRPIDYLYRGLAHGSDSVAIAGPGASVTYGELVTAIESLASGLQSIDPTPGSRIGICARNTVEHLLAMLATYVAGKVWVPLNPRNGRAELDAMIAATKPTIMIADESCVDRFSPTSAPLVLAKTATTSGAVSVGSLIETWSGTKPQTVPRSPEDAQIIKFSGGSTGKPKPVVQSMRCVESQARGLLEFFDFNAMDANLIAAPLTHGTSCFVLPIFAAGGQHVLLEDPKPRAIVEQIQSHAITTLYAPPTMIYALLDEPTASERSFPSMRHLIYSAAPMSPARIREVQHRFGPILEVAYGQVEAPQIVTAMRASDLMRPENIESVGRASSVAQVSIMGPDGAELEPGDVGEIVVQSPLVMSGYLNRPDLTAETIVDGWLHTGDLGYLDERGYLYIRGRLREVINTGGFKVFPGDVESVLAKHPAVLECCVFGVEDAKWGEAVHAAVRLADGATTPLEDLIDFVKSELDSVKAPKRIHLVNELPRNAAGKVSRGDVRSMIG